MAKKNKTNLAIDQKSSGEKIECPDNPGASFPIVGIGASAGGLPALEAFFANLPGDLGAKLAFVLVQHLPSDYKSIMGELLERCTDLPVCEAADGMVLAPNTIYTAPANSDLAIRQGRLHLAEPATPRSRRFPIDIFLRSLAADQKEHAICMILSGGGSDGTQGLRAVKAEGGMAMVQDPGSAECKSMVQSAIATGLVDFVAPPEEMPARLAGYLQIAWQRRFRPIEPMPPKSEKLLAGIFALLRAETGHDFSGYKQSAILRRIEKRLAVNQIDELTDYLRYMQSNPTEAQALFREFLVGVTGFFRNPEAFEALREKVLPRLFAGKKAGEPTRVWVAGCSTGEEAYSLAILFKEYLEEVEQHARVQIFASDIDSHAIEQARQGLYPAGIAADVSPERLKRFFTHEGDNSAFRVQKSIREMIVFAEHNVSRDPPFSRMDLVTCRNLLIYLGPELQQKCLHLFHYALLPEGFLFLGASETTGEHHYFTAVDRKWRLYRRNRENVLDPAKGLFPLVDRLPTRDYLSVSAHLAESKRDGALVEQLVHSILLQEHAPACAAINKRGDILYIHGRTGRYLEPASGIMSLNILKMAREGLKNELAVAIRQAASLNQPVYCRDLLVKGNGPTAAVNLTVRPFAAGHADYPEILLVVFEDTVLSEGDDRGKEAAAAAAEAAATAGVSVTAQRVTALERELQDRDEYLQSMIEELESANEELQSTIEEFHSTNEELETSREELQSVNEELVTVNAELQTKNEEMSRASDDMNNMIAGTGIGTIFVDTELRIKRFTPPVTRVINLIPGDLGRPVSHIASNLVDYDRMEEDLQGVLETLTPHEVEAMTKSEEWYKLRMIPYRTLDNVIEGAVINLINITEMKKLQLLGRLAVVVRDSHDAITMQDLTGLILAWNPGAEKLYGWAEPEAIGMNIRDMVPEDKRDEYLEMVKKLAAGDRLETFLTERLTRRGEIVAVWMTATILLNESGMPYAVATTERGAVLDREKG